MVTECWVVNASPLILLGKADHLMLLPSLAEQIVVPQSVADEILVKPDGARILAELTRHSRCTVVGDESVSPGLLAWDLGAGETRVIANAQHRGADRVVIDDLQARRCAKAQGLKVIGTLGVVARAKRMGCIASAAPVIERLRETGLYVAEELVRNVLAQIGE